MGGGAPRRRSRATSRLPGEPRARCRYRFASLRQPAPGRRHSSSGGTHAADRRDQPEGWGRQDHHHRQHRCSPGRPGQAGAPAGHGPPVQHVRAPGPAAGPGGGVDDVPAAGRRAPGGSRRADPAGRADGGARGHLPGGDRTGARQPHRPGDHPAGGHRGVSQDARRCRGGLPADGLPPVPGGAVRQRPGGRPTRADPGAGGIPGAAGDGQADGSGGTGAQAPQPGPADRLHPAVHGGPAHQPERRGARGDPPALRRHAGPHIRANVKLAEAPSFGQDILRYAPDSNGAADYRAFAEEFLQLVEGRAADVAPPATAPTAAPEAAAPQAGASRAGAPETAAPAEGLAENG